MGRAKGGKNANTYKYMLTKYDGPEEYFTSYPHIFNTHTELNKSAIINIIFHPERCVNNTIFSITKLTNPLPVFHKKTITDTRGNVITILDKINYMETILTAPACHYPSPRSVSGHT